MSDRGWLDLVGSRAVALAGAVVVLLVAAAPAAATPQTLSASPPPTDTLDLSDAISQDSNTIVVGAPENFTDNQASSYLPGAAYVYVRDPGSSTWSQAATLISPHSAPGDGFGYAVAVADDGSTIVVGAPGTEVAGTSGVGAVYVFSRPPGGWSSSAPAAELTPSDGTQDERVGGALALSGGTVVAGGGLAQDGDPVYVFTKPTSGWANESQAAELSLPADQTIIGNADSFATAVAVEGNTVAVSDPNAADNDGNGPCAPGQIFLFERPASGWVDTSTPDATLSPTYSDADCNSLDLGESLAWQNGTLVAGATGATETGQQNAGAVYVFEEPTDGWTNANQNAILISSQPSLDYLGASVGISGATIVADNSSYALDPGTFLDPVSVYQMPAGGWTDGTESAVLIPPAAAQPLYQMPPVALAGDTVVEGAEGQSSVVAAVFDTTQDSVAPGAPPASSPGPGASGGKPAAKITKAKINAKRDTARFSFRAIGLATAFQCALVKKPPRHHHGRSKPSFRRCGSPKTYKHLRPGSYTFEVRALSAVGAGTVTKRRFTI